MIKKGDEISVDVIELSSEGKGISKLEDGFVIFSTSTLPGDEALIKIVRKKSKYAEANLVELKKNSPFRIDPRCSYFGICGGCKIQNYEYEKQVEYKTKVVADAFQRIGGFSGITVPPAIKSDDIFFYRNKMEFSFSDDEWTTIPPGPSTETKDFRNSIPPDPPLQGGKKDDPTLQGKTEEEVTSIYPPYKGGEGGLSEDNIKSEIQITPRPPLQGGKKDDPTLQGKTEEEVTSINPPYKGGQGGLSEDNIKSEIQITPGPSLQGGNKKEESDNDQRNLLFNQEWLRKRNLILGGYHLPYNPKLVDRAREFRKNQTESEKKMWFGFLRNHQLRFLRQRPIDNFIVDFYCSEVRMVIEIDGEQHSKVDSIEYDFERTTILENVYDLKILRVTNDEIKYKFEEVCKHIQSEIDERQSIISPGPSTETKDFRNSIPSDPPLQEGKKDDPTLQGKTEEEVTSIYPPYKGGQGGLSEDDTKSVSAIPPNPPLQGGNEEEEADKVNLPYKWGPAGLNEDGTKSEGIIPPNHHLQGSNEKEEADKVNPPYKGGQGGLSEDNIKFALGLHVPKFHSKIVDIKKCFLQSELSNDILNFTRDFFKSKNISVYSTKTQTGFLRFLIIRESKNTQGVMVNLITYNYDEALMNEYSESVKKNFPGISTLINSVSNKKAQVATGEKEIILFGNGFITEKLKNSSGKEYTFKLSPQSFFQTNTLQAQKLFDSAVTLGDLNESDKVLDLYCGAGAISIFISDKVDKVLGVELSDDAINDAHNNSEFNKVLNTEFLTSDIKDFLESENIYEYNKLILDPPRAGLHPKICEILSDTNFEKIVYVSCNPHTQARDLQIICAKEKYIIEKIQPVDMFPHTYHIENIVSLKRNA